MMDCKWIYFLGKSLTNELKIIHAISPSNLLIRIYLKKRNTFVFQNIFMFQLLVSAEKEAKQLSKK